MMVNRTTPPISPDGTIDPSEASGVLNTLESLLDDIKNSNKSNAGIVMGEVIGVIQLQDKNTKRKDIDICYSSQQNLMNVVETNQKTDFPWSVKIPSEAFDKSSLQNNGSAFVGVLRYPNLGKKDETKNYAVLNNEVYGITMGANISNLTNNIEMTTKLKTSVGNASCTSWDGNGNLEWTTFGCETEMIDNNTIKCSCSHLTFFAVLMSVPDASAVAPYLDSLTLISSVGCGISVFFLAIALFMHFLLRKAKSNQATKILINILVALFLLNVSFLSNESVANSGDKNACVFIALLMHYSMLTSFTWFFIQALHMYLWLIRQNVTITNYMRKITVLGWGVSMPIVVAVLSTGGYKAVTLSSTSGKIARMCWITDLFIQYIVNIGFYSLVFIFTTIIFIIIVTNIFQSRDIRATEGKRLMFRKQLMMVLSLFLLFGLTWAVAFFSYGPMLIPSYYIFSVLNSFQGFFLFLYYYHIHNDVAGHFSDDPGSSSTTSSIVKVSNAVDNIYN
ncbi:adhesion G-protein coupled receptor G2-like [Danio rerio]|uniref:Adhesion G-protein coupled receptor G2-like n=1 Tax=Danio rerio TaxID=7955 RepID=A0AB32TKL6_DANRE